MIRIMAIGVLSLVTICLMAAEPGRLTDDSYPDMAPSWSPDGKSVAFVSRREKRQFCLVVVSLSDGKQKIMARDVAKDGSYAWSPDGALIAYTASEDGKHHVRVCDVNTEKTEEIAEGKHPAFNKSGSGLAYVNDKDLLLYSCQTKKSRNLTNAGKQAVLERLCWTPDGKTIYYAQDGNLWQVNVETGKAACVFEHAAENAISPTVSNPRVAPDGKSVFMSLINDGLYPHPVPNLLGCYHAQTGKTENLFDAEEWNLVPDGKSLFFSIGDSIYRYDILTQNKQLIISGHSPGGSPDGGSIVYLSRKDPLDENDVWILKDIK